jgi:hypothetical protein
VTPYGATLGEGKNTRSRIKNAVAGQTRGGQNRAMKPKPKKLKEYRFPIEWRIGDTEISGILSFSGESAELLNEIGQSPELDPVFDALAKAEREISERLDKTAAARHPKTTASRPRKAASPETAVLAPPVPRGPKIPWMPKKSKDGKTTYRIE